MVLCSNLIVIRPDEQFPPAFQTGDWYIRLKHTVCSISIFNYIFFAVLSVSVYSWSIMTVLVFHPLLSSSTCLSICLSVSLSPTAVCCLLLLDKISLVLAVRLLSLCASAKLHMHFEILFVCLLQKHKVTIWTDMWHLSVCLSNTVSLQQLCTEMSESQWVSHADALAWLLHVLGYVIWGTEHRTVELNVM